MKKSKKKKTIGDLIWRVVFLAALAVFCYCAFQLVTIYLEYKKGTDEYSSLEQKYVSEGMFTENEAGKTENLFPLRRMLPGQRTIPKEKRPKIRQTSRKNLIRQERPRQRSKRMKKGRPR